MSLLISTTASYPPLASHPHANQSPTIKQVRRTRAGHRHLRRQRRRGHVPQAGARPGRLSVSAFFFCKCMMLRSIGRLHSLTYLHICLISPNLEPSQHTHNTDQRRLHPPRRACAAARVRQRPRGLHGHGAGRLLRPPPRRGAGANGRCVRLLAPRIGILSGSRPTHPLTSSKNETPPPHTPSPPQGTATPSTSTRGSSRTCSTSSTTTSPGASSRPRTSSRSPPSRWAPSSSPPGRRTSRRRRQRRLALLEAKWPSRRG